MNHVSIELEALKLDSDKNLETSKLLETFKKESCQWQSKYKDSELIKDRKIEEYKHKLSEMKFE